MKRKIALFLSVFMLLTMLMPVQSFAEGEKGLEQAIKVAKEKFTIPAALTEFNYNINMEGQKKLWSLTWNSKSGNDGSINVNVDENGTIKGYSYYKPFDYSRKKLPKVTKKEALAKAEEFIKRIAPAIASQIKLTQNNQELFTDFTYFFNFARQVNGLPYYNNFANIEVNCETGEIQNYNLNWTDGLVFPTADKVISLEKAQQAYKEKLGLKLIYSSSYDDNNIKTFPIYTSKYGFNTCVDALTGEKIDFDMNYGAMAYDRAGAGESMMMNSKSAFAEPAVQISPEEQKAIEEAAKLISQEDAEKKARALKLLEITDDFKVSYASLSRDWPAKNGYSWNINFEKPLKDNDGQMRSVNVRINAKTGEIQGFYTGYPYNEGAKAKYDKVASKAAVESFLKEFQAEKFSNTEYDDIFDAGMLYKVEKENSTFYNFRFVRKVNGIQFPNNGITVGYDAVNGKVTNFELTWFDVEFAPVDKVVPMEKIYEKLFADIGMELQYKSKDPYIVYAKLGVQELGKTPEVKLVYDVKHEKPLNFDANTGAILTNEGKPYKENKPVEYKDISGCFAEKQIIALSEYGISLEGTEFKPNENITQKDFLLLLSRTMSNYYVPYQRDTNDKQIEDLYNFMIREGVVKESEKAADAAITREDAVKFIIRSLKYDKVAEIKGIFTCSFKDADKVNPDLIGYVAIAQGLKLVSGNGGYFNPDARLTRGQAAVIIYNCLQR